MEKHKQAIELLKRQNKATKSMFSTIEDAADCNTIRGYLIALCVHGFILVSEFLMLNELARAAFTDPELRQLVKEAAK